MTQTGYTSVIVNTMLGWLKTLANWVLRFFNLYSGISPIDFLVKNWLKLLVILLALGIIVDLLVWLLRWRPHWIWFGKKRVVITDKNFFAREQYADDEESQANRGNYVRPTRNWVDNDFVVKSRKPASKNPTEDQPKEKTDVFTDETFSVDAKHKFVDRYEDEVFNLEDLPGTAEQTQTNKTSASKKKREKRAK